MQGPVDLGDLAEDRREQLVERDLEVEAGDEIVDLGVRVEIAQRGRRVRGHDEEMLLSTARITIAIITAAIMM